ncbi:MAG: ribonuclease HII [Gemmatimonadota bacterium]
MGQLDRGDLAGLTIAQIQALLRQCGGGDAALWARLERDARAGVRRLAVQERRRQGREAAEVERLERLCAVERRLWATGVSRVAGVDEVGRGCLAGPVVAAAVILPRGCLIAGVDDSKVLSPQAREALSERLAGQAAAVAVGAVEAAEIDRINILQASLKAMRAALEGLAMEPEQVLVDGNRVPGSRFPERAIVDGDARSLSIAAASVVAKVHRDRLMVTWDRQYPGYGFAEHKGYASPRHLAALVELGPCPLHRRSFRPLAAAAPEGEAQLDLDLGSATADVGARGEELAADYLRARGYRILARRYRGGGGEIDLIARDHQCLAFIEVKTAAAGGLAPPEERVRPQQQTRIARAARHYLRGRSPGSDCRFDVIAVVLRPGRGPEVHHLPDAFTLDGG